MQGDALAYMDRTTVDAHDRPLLSALVALHQAQHISIRLHRGSMQAPLPPHSAGDVFQASLGISLMPSLFSTHPTDGGDGNNDAEGEAECGPSGQHVVELLLRLGSAAAETAAAHDSQAGQLVASGERASISSAGRGGGGGGGDGGLTGASGIPLWLPPPAGLCASPGAAAPPPGDVRDEVFALVRPTGWALELPNPEGVCVCVCAYSSPSSPCPPFLSTDPPGCMSACMLRRSSCISLFSSALPMTPACAQA